MFLSQNLNSFPAYTPVQIYRHKQNNNTSILTVLWKNEPDLQVILWP